MLRHKEIDHERLGTIIFFGKFKIKEKNLRKLNCSYGKVSHTLKQKKMFQFESFKCKQYDASAFPFKINKKSTKFSIPLYPR